MTKFPFMCRALIGPMILVAVTASYAATFSVTTTSDSGPGSLRDAVAQANAAPGADAVDFSVTGTITLTSGQIAIGGPLTIIGPGAGALTIDGNGNSRIFSISAAEPSCPALDGPDYLVSISGVRLTNARRNADSSGGAIFSEHGLSLASVVVDNSAAGSGGAVFMSLQYPGQPLNITDSQFSNNVAKLLVPTAAGLFTDGGAIHVSEKCAGTRTTSATVTIARSVFRGNRAQPTASLGGDGGAISARFAGELTITDSRIVDNHVDLPSPAPALYGGGGLFVVARSLRIERTEIAENSADWGGGVYLLNDAPELQVPGSPAQVQMINSTVAANRAISRYGGALLIYGNVALEIDNSTVSDNVSQANGMGAGIQLHTGPATPASTTNALAPTLKLVSSIVANLGADIATVTSVMPATTIDVTRSLIKSMCTNCNITVAGTGNLPGVDPMMNPLAFNGGPTRTNALYPGSLAINAGSNPLALTTDQRGAPYWRAGSGATDMGALESDAVPAVNVVEFYNGGLDHYFITWVPDEIAKLDDGTLRGWARTGLSFKAYPVMQPETSAVCRIYIPPGKGDGHFFGRDSNECDGTMAKNPTFVLESPGFFFLYPPNLGTCLIGRLPVYRVFSNRADANHRYTTSRAVRDQMVAKGWLAEGDGPNIVVMCAPQ